MAQCAWCQQETTDPTVTACTAPSYTIAGIVYARVPNTDELRGPNGLSERCHDCTVVPGALHHPGCDSERCPRCGEQAIACSCVEEEEKSHG